MNVPNRNFDWWVEMIAKIIKTCYKLQEIKFTLVFEQAPSPFHPYPLFKNLISFNGLYAQSRLKFKFWT